MAKNFKGFVDKFRGFSAEFPKDKTRICASSFAYYCFLSVVPLIALCVSMVSHIGVSQDEVVTFISAMVPDSLDELVETLVGEAYIYSNVLISINTIILIWASSSGVWSLHNGLNEVLGLEDTQGKTISFFKSLLYTVIAGVGFALIMFLSVRVLVLETVLETTPGLGPGSWIRYAVNMFAGMSVTVIAVAACYAYLPLGRRRFRKQLPSALLAIIVCNLLWYLIDFLMSLVSSPDTVFSSLAAAMLFIFWIYLTGYVFLTCGFLSSWLAGQSADNSHGATAIGDDSKTIDG